MTERSNMYLLAVKNLILVNCSRDYHSETANSQRNHTCEGQEHQEHEPECRDVSNPSGGATHVVEVPGSAHQEVFESRKKKEAEKEKQILLCKKNVKRNFVWRRCYKRNVKKLFSGRQCRPG